MDSFQFSLIKTLQTHSVSDGFGAGALEHKCQSQLCPSTGGEVGVLGSLRLVQLPSPKPQEYPKGAANKSTETSQIQLLGRAGVLLPLAKINPKKGELGSILGHPGLLGEGFVSFAAESQREVWKVIPVGFRDVWDGLRGWLRHQDSTPMEKGFSRFFCRRNAAQSLSLESPAWSSGLVSAQVLTGDDHALDLGRALVDLQGKQETGEPAAGKGV